MSASSLSPIASDRPAKAHSAPRAPRLPLDPLLTLAVIGLGICSILTLRVATDKLIPSDPHYYVERQAIYLIVGFIANVADHQDARGTGEVVDVRRRKSRPYQRIPGRQSNAREP